jgi:hypothetical protein
VSGSGYKPQVTILFLKYIYFSVSVEGPEAASGLDGQLSHFPGTEKNNDSFFAFLNKKERYRFQCTFSIPR